jgi:two-component system sensor histidine kinase PilS (NtrC family)
VRTSLQLSDEQLRLVLDRRRFVRWVYLVRLAVAAAIYLSGLVAQEAQIASAVFTIALLFTLISVWRTESGERPPSDAFLYIQHFFDAFLVTAIVHVTGGEESQLAALYILVNTSAALMLPIGGSLLLAVLGCVLYAADVLLLSDATMSMVLGQQLAVFFIVALGTGTIGARLKEMSSVTEELAEELTQVRLQAADILRNIRAAIITIDERGALVYANPAASDLLATDLAALVGRSFEPLVEPASRGLLSAVRRALREGVHVQREEAEMTAGGRTFPIGITTTSNVVDVTHGGRSVTVIFQDITDQKQVDEFRRRAERLEAVAELSASLAHEIKNPLASIRSAVEQLGRSPSATTDEQTLAGLVVRESDRLSRLLSEFLDFARTRVTSIGALDVAAVTRTAARVAAEHPSCSNAVTIAVRAPSDPVVIDGDEDLLHRAVFNLALNAVQASAEGSVVTISVGPASLGPLPAGVSTPRDAIEIVIEDTGPGIAPEVRDRLFEPFTTTKPGGSGLGLSVVHRAVEAHRGIVLVDSTEQGTTFRIVLPRRQAVRLDLPGANA